MRLIIIIKIVRIYYKSNIVLHNMYKISNENARMKIDLRNKDHTPIEVYVPQY